MRLFTSEVERLRRWDLEAALAEAAVDGTFCQFLVDDLAFRHDYPPEWEPHVVAASQRAGLADPQSYLFICASILVRRNSTWPGLPDLLARLLDLDASVLAFERVAMYALTRKGDLPEGLCRSAARNAARTWLPGRVALYVDWRTRRMISTCAARGWSR